jgi:tetratricopeptide (TPR) repeat protein
MNATVNPVEQRLLYLCELWSQFTAADDKRLLVWQVQENAVRIVHCFFEVQKHQTDYTTGDMFLVFDTPFEHSLQYSKALKVALRGQYDASHEDLQQEGLEDDWSFQPEHTADNAAGVLEALRSFGAKYHRSIGRLAAVFTPSAIAHEQRFSTWLLQALERPLPERLRLVTLDSQENPRLRHLTSQERPEVLLQRPAIDAMAVAQETFAQEKTTGPAGVFRNLMMGVVTLIEKGSADAVTAKAKDAVTFARKQQWLDQEVVLRIMVAGALLKELRYREAVRVYHGARETAETARAAQHPAGAKLVLQTWFGEAGAHLAANDPLKAAACYDSAAELAIDARDVVMAVEAYRMSGFCFAKAGDAEAAIARLHASLDLGRHLKPEARGMTTLPIAAMDLLRVLDAERVVSMQQVRARLDERLEQAGNTLEERAQSASPADSAVLEQQHEDELEQAHAQGDAELAEVVAAAPEPFTTAFQRGRELLGEEWPLDNAIALPAPVKEGTAA